MPKKPKIEVEITFTSIPDDEFKIIISRIKDWYVDEFIRFFKIHIKELAVNNSNTVANTTIDLGDDN